MKQVKVLLLVTVAVLMMAGGCSSHYKVTDLNTGTSYYTKDVDKTNTGAAEFDDARTGQEVVIQNSDVKKVTKKEYKEAVNGNEKVKHGCK